MNRRQYLSFGATGVVLGVAGCMGDTEEFPPYPDSESFEFSGEGDTTTDHFELVNDGPMILDVQHEGDERFVTYAIDDEDTFVQGGPTVQAVGPYRGSSIHNLELDEYRLEIEADGEWTATVYDLPAYEDGIGHALPFEREGALGSAIGPIDFGEPSQKEIEIRFDEAVESNWVDLVDRNGEIVGTLFEGSGPVTPDDVESDDTDNSTDSEDNETADNETNETVEDDADDEPESSEQTQQLDLSGVGYLSVESGTSWTISVTEIQ